MKIFEQLRRAISKTTEELGLFIVIGKITS
jgi:hypothetical protein